MSENQETSTHKQPPAKQAIQHENSEEKDASDSSTSKEVSSTLAERHPDWPPIKVKFYFSPHRTAEDMAGMKERLKESDIYFYEHPDGDYPTPILQKFADEDPDKLPADYLDKKFNRPLVNGKPDYNTAPEMLFRSLYGSKKIVGHMDLRPDDPISFREIKEVSEQPFLDPSFDKTLDNIKQELKIGALQEDIREKIMVKRFEEELGKIIDAYPELKDKPDIKILATLGSFHTSAYHKFIEAGIETERAFPRKNYKYSYDSQALREFINGREPSRDLLAKAYIERLILSKLSDSIEDKIGNTDHTLSYVRQLASNFTTQEIENTHKLITEKGFISVEEFNDMLREKELNPLPKNDEELREQVNAYEDKEQAAAELRLEEAKERNQKRRLLQKPHSSDKD